MDCPNCGTEKMYYWEKKAIGLRWKGYECHNCFCKIQTATIKGVGASMKVIKKILILKNFS